MRPPWEPIERTPSNQPTPESDSAAAPCNQEMSKKLKGRSCPVVGTTIPVVECGEKRVSYYACPPGCPHNPFALPNYNHFLELEERVHIRSLERLLAEAPDAEHLAAELARHRRSNDDAYANAFISWHIFRRQQPDGTTFADCWQRAEFPGFKNDDRVIFRALRQTRIVLLEVHRILDAERTKAVDLLDPSGQTLLIVDRGLASAAPRFATYFTSTYPLPHYHRVTGGAILVPDFQGFEPQEILREISRHLGAPAEESALRLWLAEHFERFCRALEATAYARRRALFRNIDAEFGKVTYTIEAPIEEARNALDTVADVAPDNLTDAERSEGLSDARVWFDDQPGNRFVPASNRPVLGRVLLGPTQFRLEAMSKARTAELRRRFETLLGPRARFLREERDDVASLLERKEPDYDPTLVPPRLLEHPGSLAVFSSRTTQPIAPADQTGSLASFQAAYDRAYLDLDVPLLEGKTPRQAASDPVLRPKLVRLMKTIVSQRDEENLKTGRTDDLNWMLRELGLTEIIFDPPPPRPPPSSMEEEDSEDDAFAEDGPPLSEPPRLVGAPWTFEEAKDRLRDGVECFATAAAALEALQETQSTLIEDAIEVLDENLDEAGSAILATLMLQVAFAFCPPGTRQPEVNLEILTDAFQQELRKLAQAAQALAPNPVAQQLEDSAQPNFVKLLALNLFASREELPKKQRPRVESMIPLLLFLKCVVDLYDESLR